MRFREKTFNNIPIVLTIVLTSIIHAQTASIKDVFTSNQEDSPRVARDNKYYIDRFGTDSRRVISSSRQLKPEESPEARTSQSNTGIEKRCSRCDSDSSDYRGGSSYYRGGSSGGGGDSRYSDPRYDTRRNYDDRYDSYDRFDPYDSYYDSYERDRYRRPYSGRDDYDRYEPRYDRYDKYDRYNRDRYDDRQYNRGVGYDNIGYDYRGYDNRNSYRPSDETYRGTSGWDSTGRGYYFNRGLPESSSGKWGTYASSWGYGRDDRDRGYRDEGYRGQYRPREYSNYGTSYLYGRPSSSTTTSIPSNPQDSDNSVTDSPNETSVSG